MTGTRAGEGVDYSAVFSAVPTPYLLLDPDLVVVAANQAYLQATERTRTELVGRHVFDAFPDNPATPHAQATANLGASLRRVLTTGRPDTMPLQEYDVPTPDGGFRSRWWSPVNAPVLDETGRVLLVLHRVEDVTDYVLEQLGLEQPGADARPDPAVDPARGMAAGSALRTARADLAAAEGDLFARGQELRAALTAEAETSRRLAVLAEVALSLIDIDDLDDLVRVLAEQGPRVVGCDGGAIAVPDPDAPDVLVSYITDSFTERVRAENARLPLQAPLPVCEAARTRRTVLLPDLATTHATYPAMVAAAAGTGQQAFASVPMHSGERLLGVLSATWVQPQVFTPQQLDVLETYAALCTQAVQRLAARRAERAAAAAARAAADTAHRAAAQQTALVDVAHALGRTQDEAGVLEVVALQGVRLLGASGSALCLREGDGTHVRVLATDTFSADVRAAVQLLPLDFPLPLVSSAATGASHFLPDRDATVALFPGARELHVRAGMQASVSVALHGQDQVLGSLSMGFTRSRDWSPEDRDLVTAFASLTAQALDRIAARDAERAATATAARFAETLQRSMLTDPPQPDHLEIAVRYSPATTQLQVGGDWYDAFRTTSGATSLVIGDVAGHDQTAAAVMGQLRNLLRGIGHALGAPPAAVLRALDEAAHDLGVDGYATVVAAQVEQPAGHLDAGTWVLRWSNAGHPAPLLLEPGLPPRFLDTEPDLIIGIDPRTDRHDHEVVLSPGSTLLLYTDGLVERRGASLDEGAAWLADAVQDLRTGTLDRLCDGLLELVGHQVEDDVALLALRTHPQDRPRPAEAGPALDPLRVPTLPSDGAGPTG